MFNTFNLKMLIVKTNLFKKITRILKTKSAKNYNQLKEEVYLFFHIIRIIKR